MTELRAIAQNLMEKVIRDPAVETAWLSALARMEEVAARQIRTNISAFTPDDERNAILEHAADEDRHASMIQAMKPIPFLNSPTHLELEDKLCRIAEHFVVGYFGNPLLITAKNKHAAYAHGAVTIEQFPFQVYTAYLKATQLPSVKQQLPDVIRDEQSHIQLGKRLLSKLPPEEALSVEKLQEIEEDMCCRMMERMSATLDTFFKEESGELKSTAPQSFEGEVCRSYDTTVAWTYTIGYGEKLGAEHLEYNYVSRGLQTPEMMPAHMADELRHGRMLQRTVVLDRRRLQKKIEYKKMEDGMIHAMKRYQLRLFSSIMRLTSDPDLIYYYGGLALEMRVFRHYKAMAEEVDHAGIGHVLGVILHEEAEHTRLVSTAIKESPAADNETFRKVSEIEKGIWADMTLKVSKLIAEYRESQGLVSALSPVEEGAYV